MSTTRSGRSPCNGEDRDGLRAILLGEPSTAIGVGGKALGSIQNASLRIKSGFAKATQMNLGEKKAERGVYISFVPGQVYESAEEHDWYDGDEAPLSHKGQPKLMISKADKSDAWRHQGTHLVTYMTVAVVSGVKTVVYHPQCPSKS